ncbi:MAG: CDP-diacylglycerol--serine O-phosphatidyltransferase [Deltaproteobacteria bacterium]|nr:CDP-diacylglycerol--serine O-phosphatidyltransferase [Deltaproteobacteria bacterium]MBN2687893.1 CDP-diacylglycerol--serine O-phosphatidyltransferase [Deltaproteobacteria bacterium]
MIKRPTITSDGMRKGIYVLPNLFTTASLFCGFYAIIASMRENFFYAAVSILIAGILDGLDGRIARFTNTTSKFGSEYDSLADLVAFGVAPGILAYTWALSPFGRYGWLVAFLFVACGALRLARFNIQIGIVESKVFNGLPIPAAAGVVAGSVLFYDYVGGTGHFNHISILLTVVALAFLMVSSIKFYSFKDVNYFSRKPFITLVLVVFVFTVIVMEPQLMIFTMAVGYACSGPAWSLYKLFRRNKKAREEVKKYVNKV